MNDDGGQAGPRPRHRAVVGGGPGPGPRPLAAAGALEAAMWVASEMGSVGSSRTVNESFRAFFLLEAPAFGDQYCERVSQFR